MLFNFLSTKSKKVITNKSSEQSYQIEIFDIIADFVGDKNRLRSVFDVGAHSGSFSSLAKKKFSNAKVFAFEPYKKSFEILESNLPENDCIKFNLALSDFHGKQVLNVNSFDETNSLYDSVLTNSEIDGLIENVTKVEVGVSTLDKVCQDNNCNEIDFLKIDVQGNELNVLKGAAQLLHNNKISFIQCEVEFIEIYKGQPLYHEIATFLYQSGFRLYSLYNLHFDINKRFSWADSLFIHKSFLNE